MLSTFQDSAPDNNCMAATLNPSLISQENTGYLEVGADHLYTVRHKVQEPTARVLLVGSFAAERNHSYLPWVRWARYLAARDIEVLRYDHRGVGESTGKFEHMTLSTWLEDVGRLALWLEAQTPAQPVILHGLNLGAVLAARAFEQGFGDGLLLWAAPKSANAVLRTQLVHWVTLQNLSSRAEKRKPFAEYVRELEQKGSLEVSGYRWSHRLWMESFSFELPARLITEQAAATTTDRPVHILPLSNQASPLIRGGMAGYEEANDLTWVYEPSFQWLRSAAALMRARH